jgi:hypothetical protein
VSFGKISPACRGYSPQAQIADSSSNKGSQAFIRTRNKTLPAAAMCVCNPDRATVEINR